MRSLCVVVPRSEGESVRKKLSEMGLLNTDCKVRVDGDTLLIPVREEVDLGLPVVEEEFEVRGPRYTSYKEAVEGVPGPLMDMLPTAFDVVGDVAVIKVPDDLVPYKDEVGRAMLRANPSVRLVAMDAGVTGESRVRDLVAMAGEGGFETIHKEHGLRYMLDVSRCYFSPRLATERKRVADLVRDGERVLDMFAGVGPFSILVARTARVESVRAVDINPVAVEYLRRNIVMNKAIGVEAVLADARDAVRSVPPVDRIIMNLPHTAWQFLPDAILACANDATIHYYEILNEPEGRPAKIEAAGHRVGREVEVVGMHEVRSYSPSEVHYAFDIKVFTGHACTGPPGRAGDG